MGMILENGWLHDEIVDASVQVCVNHSPSFFQGSDVPIDKAFAREHAQEIYDRMASRFEEWTGCKFSEFAGRQALDQNGGEHGG